MLFHCIELMKSFLSAEVSEKRLEGMMMIASVAVIRAGV